ncbi:uncharacterized protein LOC115925120 [Strongylocentrotus purpuratus]|uniref:NACHT domain-containing protein n=1 Tax=Strongylocentrotus purpuratus TaxID=7668 RepID=A0A7M7P2F9_STRPU|nr:uncharacterized protein LOC115925120 [Strongylocentrotus purpuratus]
MLRDWRNTQRKAEERSVLLEAFREIKREDLAKLLTAPDDLPQHDLLKSVVKDIKKYYCLNMCTIQADPTNNDVMFEFDRIYTDPTLREEDRNDKTKRNSLLYCNLLKTKINGQSPNRLLVQGRGGAGKTTFCSKIAWDWANDLGFQQFKLVAVISFRKAKNKTVGEVIKSYLPDDNPFTAAQIDEYILSNQEDVFLVFDGLDELWGKLSHRHQINRIIRNLLFMSGTVLVTSRQWRADEICSSTELKKVYAFIYLEGFSVDSVAAYITKFFHQDAAPSQELIDFITSNDVIADNMAPFPIFCAMLCIMWRESDGKRREAMSKLKTFSQVFEEMVDFLVDHYGSKDDFQTGPTVQELRQMIPNHLKAIGEIAFQGIKDRRLEFPEDTFQSCRESMEMGCKVGVLTREKHATPRCDRRNNPHLEMSMVQFPHKLFQEFMAAKYLASLHSSDHNRYERIIADFLAEKLEFRYLLYFTSAQGSDLGLDIVTRLIAQKRNSFMNLFEEDYGTDFIIDVAYESQQQSAAEKVVNQLMGSWTTLVISDSWSSHTLSGFLFIRDHLHAVDSLVLTKGCGRKASQDIAEFILSTASLRTLVIRNLFGPMHYVFYSILADKAQQCKIQNLTVESLDLHDQQLSSRDLAVFICQMPYLESLSFFNNKLHEDFFSKRASIVSSAKGNNHTSLRELTVDPRMVVALQSTCGDMFDRVEKLSFSFFQHFEFDFLQRVHGFQGVTELTIGDGSIQEPYPSIGEPSSMFKHLERVFPQLVKLTFRIDVGNAILKQVLESLRETRGLPLSFKSSSWESMEIDGWDELLAIRDKINNENVFRVEVETLH